MRSGIDNQDLITPANSWSKWVGVKSPKATVTFLPGESWWVPLISAQLRQVVLHGRSRRDGVGLSTARRPLTPVETARSYQLVASKTFHQTDLKLTLGHETQTAEYGKIDPDQGLQFRPGTGTHSLSGGHTAPELRQRIAAGDL